jgi:hypothetical protein
MQQTIPACRIGFILRILRYAVTPVAFATRPELIHDKRRKSR